MKDMILELAKAKVDNIIKDVNYNESFHRLVFKVGDNTHSIELNLSEYSAYLAFVDIYKKNKRRMIF